MHYQGRILSGKAYLETDHLLFRGGERIKIGLRSLQSVAADEGMLTLEFPGGAATLELGAAAAKWAHRILHPPSRAGKLGIRPGLAVRLDGEFENAFLEELRDVTLVSGRAKADMIFFAAGERASLSRVARLATLLKPDGSLWVIYPKGVQVIREIDVLSAGRAAGLKDTKVAAFSSTHTALRFVIPVSRR